MEKGGGRKLTRGQATSFGFRRPDSAQVSTSGRKQSESGRRKEAPALRKTAEIVQPAVTVQETIQPLLIAPLQPKPPASAVAPPPRDKSANRFGFRGPTLSNKVADLQVPLNSPAHPPGRSLSEPRKYRLEWSQLPRAQCAVRVPTAAGYSAEADKRAKTAANTALSSVGGADSRRVSKPEPVETEFEIQELEESPSMGNKFRQTQHQLQLQHRQNLLHQQREEQKENGRVRGLCQERGAPSINHMAFSSNDETGDEGFDETSTEEKQTRDKEANEKDALSSAESPTEEMWGRGEAMAVEEELAANFSNISQSPGSPPLRSVLLKIEDPTFAPLAALSQSALLEDETLPESPDLSCSSPSSVEPLPPPPTSLSPKGSPGSPGTPTHGSTSLSGSDTRDRDFLIDDEIADQPGLVFDNRSGHRLLHTSRKISKLADEVSEALASVNPKLSGSRQSISSLSPCDSLTSDDLIADFDTSDLSNFEELDDTALKSELQSQSGQLIREWSSILSSHPGLKSSRRRGRISSGGSTRGDSPQSGLSPARSRRLGMNSPGDDGSDDSGIRVDRGTYQHMFQDVINIKSMLVRLQRILQEDGGSCQEDEGEELADLRRQVVLLCAQLDERNRRISKLEEELSRRSPQARSPHTHSNKATQTDRIRPMQTSQALFQSSPDNSTASFVSCLSEKERKARCIPRRTDA